MIRHLLVRLRSLFRRDRLEQELDTELQYHLDMLTEQHEREGMTRREARRAALRLFGSVEGVKDDVRDAWLSRVVETIAQDVSYAVRSLRRNPGFTFTVLLTMALGIGANSAIFSVVNAVLLRPLPYPDGDHLVVLRQAQPKASVANMGFSYKDIVDYRAARTLSDVVEYHDMWFILLGRAEPERVETRVVSANFFDVLGVTPLYGRTFTAADDKPGAPAVLVLSHGYWKYSFGGDPNVVGKVFRMNDRPHTVIGVLPPVPTVRSGQTGRLQAAPDVDVYMPTSACPFRSAPHMMDGRSMRMMNALARVRPEFTHGQSQADLDVVAARLARTYPNDYPSDDFKTVATPLRDELTRSFTTTLYVLLGTAGFVLLIVCASIANLLLARTVRRERELSVRSALGADRSRLLRQLLTESLLLAVCGGLLGLAFAAGTMRLLVLFAERFTPRAAEIAIDRSVLLFTLGLSVFTGLVFGSIPAWSGRFEVVAALQSGGRATPARQTLRNALIVAQVAVSFMLLIAAGLTLRSALNLQQVDPGVRTDHVLTMRVDLNYSKYPGSLDATTRLGKISGFWQRFEQRLRGLPGVIDVAGSGTFPLNEQGPFTGGFQIEGRRLPAGTAPLRTDIMLATPDYFRTVNQPILAGRAFTTADRGQTSQVVIINHAMARHYWPNEDPVGKRIADANDGRNGQPIEWSRIVGVAADTRQRLDLAPRDEVYIPLYETAQLTTTWLVHSTLDPDTMARAVRQAMYALDPEQPVDRFRTLTEIRATSLEAPRLTATLIGIFALLALVITAAGIAGVIAFSVNQRTQEFGIRMALGAHRARVVNMVLRQALTLVGIGLVLGTAAAAFVTQLLATLLFEVEPTDGATFITTALVLALVAMLACLAPARRAASVDPIVALRAL
jgi:putative ABC transport system permease protein